MRKNLGGGGGGAAAPPAPPVSTGLKSEQKVIEKQKIKSAKAEII